MAEYQSSLPFVDLGTGDRIVVEAVDPTTGAHVAGVTFSNVAITYTQDDVLQLPSLGPKPVLIRQKLA